MTGFLYAIEAQNGLVKFGRSVQPWLRAAQYQGHSPVPVRMVAYWPGDAGDEAILHQRFSEQASHFEWFRIEGPVALFLDGVRGRGVDRIRDWSEFVCAPGETHLRKRFDATSRGNKARFSDPAYARSFSITMRTSRRFARLYDERLKAGLLPPNSQDRERIRLAATAEVDAEREVSA